MNYAAEIPLWVYVLRNRLMDVYIAYRTFRTPKPLRIGHEIRQIATTCFVGPVDFSIMRDLADVYFRNYDTLTADVAARALPDDSPMKFLYAYKSGGPRWRYALTFCTRKGEKNAEATLFFPHRYGTRRTIWYQLANAASIDEVGDLMELLTEAIEAYVHTIRSAAE